MTETTELDDGARQRLPELDARFSLKALEIETDQQLSSQQRTALRVQNTAEYWASLADLVGEEKAAFYIAVGSGAEMIPIAEDFATRCAKQGDPITPAAKAQILINLGQNLRNPDSHIPQPLGPDGTPLADAAALKNAQQVLTERQMEVFRSFLAEHPYPGRSMDR